MVESNNCSFEEKNVCLCGLPANDGIPIPLLHLMCSLCLPRLSCQWYWMHPRRYDNPVTIGWFTDFTVSIGCSPYKYTLVGGFNPLKNMSSSDWIIPTLGENKSHVWNHQPVLRHICSRESQTFICPGYPVLPIGGIKTEAQKKTGDSHALSIKSSFQCINPPKKKWWFEIHDNIHGWHPWLIS